MFLSSPLGALCMIVICITSLVNIYAYWIDDGLVGRLLYMALALTSGIGAWQFIGGDVAPVIAGTFICLFSLTSVRNVIVRTSRYFKYRKYTHAKKHQ